MYIVGAINELRVIDCTHGFSFPSSCDVVLPRKKKFGVVRALVKYM